MTGRRRLGLIAAGATLLAAAPITTIFSSWTWLAQCILVVGLVAGAALLARTLRFPVWAQAVSQLITLLLILTWMYPAATGTTLIPGPTTFEHFADLFRQAGQDTRQYAVPVPDRDGLLFVTVLGIGAVSIVVDLLTVIARRPALAGLPMLAIYSIPVAVYVDSVPALPFVVGAAGFLWLLVSDNVDRVRRFGRRFTGDGRDVDVWEPSPLAAAGRRLGVLGVIAAVLLPLAVPTISGGLLSQLTQSGTGAGQGGLGSGNGGRINLFASLSGQLTQNDTVDLVKLTTNEPEPFYLRFGVADVLNSQGFANRTPSGNGLGDGLPDPRAGVSGGEFKQYHAEVEVTDALRQGQLPVYTNPTRLTVGGRGWSYDPNQQVVFTSRDTTRGKKYQFDYLRASYTAGELRDSEELREQDPMRMGYTSVPQDETVKSLVAELTAGQRTPYDKVLSLYRYFAKENGFSYSLSTQEAGDSSAIAAFLQNKIGYCQQYAAALAWMVREAGIPARVAFGFTRGSARDGNTYVITNRNAHAWTEVWFQGFGWVPFDATPSAGVAGSARAGSDYAPDVDQTQAPTAAPTAGDNATANPSAGASAGDLPQRGADNPAAGGSSDTAAAPVPVRNLWIAALVAALLALLAVPALRRALLRRRRHAATVPPTVTTTAGPDHDIVITTETHKARDDAHAAWDELVDTMVDYRVPIDPTETPRVTAQRLVTDAELQEEPATAAVLLGTAEERARYARTPLQGAELTAALTRVRHGLAHAATRRVRFMAAVFPPSVLMRWRRGLTDGSARLAAAGGRAAATAARFSPRRLMAGRSSGR